MEAQRQSIETALNLVETMNEPGVHVSNLSWPDGESWKPVYGRVSEANTEQLLQMGKENRARRASDKAQGLTR